jgi:hypothetical protein
MSRRTVLRHEFVEYVPEVLDEGVLYVNIRYATAVHLCCCGCGIEVATPLSPADWQLTFDGETVTLHPSIGNWSLPCRSHYWIRTNRVLWARQWTAREIAEARERDQSAAEMRFRKTHGQPVDAVEPDDRKPRIHETLWQRILRALS